MQIRVNEGLNHLKAIKMSDLTPSQKNLKTLSPNNYERLKKSILEKGFCFPMFIWPFEGKNYILDGHQRQIVFLQEEWQMPIPCVFIEADSHQDAKEKLLVCTSQYGTIALDGLRDFMYGLDWDWVDDMVNFDAIPVLDFSDLKDPDNYDLKEPGYKKEVQEKSTETCKCPNCGHEFQP